MLANSINRKSPSIQDHAPSQDVVMIQRRSNNTSQHPCFDQQPACSRCEWSLNDDLSQGPGTDNYIHHFHLDLSVDYILLFNEEYHMSPVALRPGD